ncbi:MAG TPA: class I SAM-dependent methyltransferase [Chthoniobacterales bacterium]|jgi:SAM-dependent methyltransferase|nr:class I SAM-dependent methyltransferase [Chthoniobacterales bacterium]
MKLSHKLAKLGQPLTYRRAWRRAERHLHPISYNAIVAGIDPARLAEIKARYADSTEHYAKYADVQRWIRLNIERAQDLKLQRSNPKSILDLGCGCGFFLLVAQQLGHSGVGLDADGFPLFGELLDLFKVDRRILMIEPFQPLPDLGRKFDLVTAFSVEFNRKGEWWWGPREWAFFLDDLARLLNPGGQVFLGLNPGKDKQFYTPELRDFFVSRGASVERENVLFPSLSSRSVKA